MTNLFKSLAIISALSLSAVSATAYAMQNDVIAEAKSTCTIGEQIDGYLGVVDGKEASIEQMRELRSINQQRKAYYADLATKNGVTVDVTEQLTAKQLIENAKTGQCVQVEDGSWVAVP